MNDVATYEVRVDGRSKSWSIAASAPPVSQLGTRSMRRLVAVMVVTLVFVGLVSGPLTVGLILLVTGTCWVSDWIVELDIRDLE